MKLDEAYTSIDICPVTGDEIETRVSNDGVCRFCGDDGGSLIHRTKIVGRWNRPTMWESLIQKKKAVFVYKADEDKIINALS